MIDAIYRWIFGADEDLDIPYLTNDEIDEILDDDAE